MALLNKSVWIIASNRDRQSIHLYSTLGEVQNTGVPLVVDGVKCWAKYGDVNNKLASKARIKKGGATYALQYMAKPPGGVAVYTSVGSNTFTVPAGCTRVRITACAGGGGGGGACNVKSKVYSGQAGGKGASVNNRYVNVIMGQTYTIVIGAGGAGGAYYGRGGYGGGTSFGNLLSLAGGIGGEVFNKFVDTSISPFEINIDGFGYGGAGGVERSGGGHGGAGGYMKIEFGGDI